jgi:hypothetical protein
LYGTGTTGKEDDRYVAFIASHTWRLKARGHVLDTKNGKAPMQDGFDNLEVKECVTSWPGSSGVVVHGRTKDSK